MLKKLVLFLFGLFCIVSLVMTGCGSKSNTTTAATQPRGITGQISTGKTTEVASSVISSSGGTITVTEPDSPLTGMKIEVPADAYPGNTQFKISYSIIEKHNFGENINPVTPLIKVENGGGHSSDLIMVTIPITISDDSLAMGFYYHETTGTLEGMPLITADNSSITIATSHFSSFIISSIPKTLLTGDVDTRYKPGVDDWEISNWGSIIVGSQCAGQSISSIWYYYTQPDGANVHLFNHYDNNGDEYKTPDLEDDDSLAIKLVTSLQVDYEDRGWQLEKKLRESTRIDDATTLNVFRYAMLATGLPQLLTLSSEFGGHALVAYKVINNTIYVADPNAPGNTDVKYSYDPVTGKFDAGRTIYYSAVSAVVDWSQIARRWAELKSGTIGNDRYPGYQIQVLDNEGKWIPLSDGHVSANPFIEIMLVPGVGAENVFTFLKVVTGPAQKTGKLTKRIELVPGNNRVGIEAQGHIKEDGAWAGFQYFTVVYSNLTVEPSSVTGEPGQKLTFTAKTANAEPGIRFEWLVDGKGKQKDADTTFTTSFDDEGEYTITVKMLDKDGKELAAAQATVGIKEAGAGAYGGYTGMRFKVRLWANGITYNSQFDKTDEQGQQVVFDCEFRNITWNGDSFTGTVEYNGGNTGRFGSEKLSGQVNADGVLTFTIIQDWKYDDGTVNKAQCTLTGVPPSSKYPNYWLIQGAAEMAKYITGNVSYYYGSPGGSYREATSGLFTGEVSGDPLYEFSFEGSGGMY